MTHVFDTAAPLPQRTIVRRGVVELLSKLTRANGGYLHSVKGFGSIVRTYTDEQGVEFLQKQLAGTPSIGVMLATRTFETLGIGKRQALSDLQIVLFFATQHGRDGVIGRHEADPVALANDTADPGLDVIMEHAIELMHGSLIAGSGGTVKNIEIKLEQELDSSGPMTIWMQTYEVKLQSYTGSKEFRTAEQLINSLHWRVTNDAGDTNRPTPSLTPDAIDVDSDPPGGT